MADAKAKYLVKSPLDHNGKRYEIGKTVDLTDDEAEPLLPIDVVEPAEKQAEKATKGGK